MDEADGGIDRKEILAQIAGALPMEAPPAPPPPEELPPAELVPEPAPQVPPSRLPARPPRWFRHRHEVAGLVTAFVAIIWLCVGISVRSWSPALVGVGFALGAFMIGAFAVWPGD